MNWGRSALTFALVTGAALVHSACGSSDSSGSAAAPTGDASIGGTMGSPDGSAGESGSGNGGRGGSANGGNGGAGNAAGAGASGNGGAFTDAGLDCTPVAEVPAPITPSVDAKPSCTGPAACGGNVDGKSFSYLDVCVDQDKVFAATYQACPGSQLNGIGDRTVTGTLSFASGTATHQATIKGTGVFQIPVECHACNCKDLQDVTLHDLGVSAFCYQDCYPDNSCRCLIDFEIDVNETEGYTANGTTLTLASGKKYDYCAGADGLSLTETGASPLIPGTVSLVPPSALNSPEICDGVDNDHDGTVDDDPVDCPVPCNTKGVCAEVKQTCAGVWTCEYTSTALEQGDETRCDGLDNDCDGLVDEGLVGCVEICDGLDNDNDGTVDNHLTDTGCPTARGVCAAGVTAVCNGASGWQCNYTSTAYQRTENKCDGQDNDCDGLVDEGCTCSTGQSKMFVLRMGATDAGVVRANLDGTNPEFIFPIPQYTAFNLALDPSGERLYFYDFAAQALRRIKLDGTSPENVWSGKTQQFAIDPGAPQRGFVENDIYQIRSFLFSAATTTTTIIQTASVAGMTVDPIHQHVYWSDHGGTKPNGIMRANYDGTNETGVFGTAIFYPAAIAVDPVDARLYYADGLGTHSVTLTGNDDKLVLPISAQNAAPSDVTLDLGAGKMYVTEQGASGVRRANLDGTSPEPLVSGSVVQAAQAIVLYLCSK